MQKNIKKLKIKTIKFDFTFAMLINACAFDLYAHFIYFLK